MSRPRKYPFHDLAPGEHTTWPWPDAKPGAAAWRMNRDIDLLVKRASNAAYAFGRLTGRRLSVHKTTAGIRFVRHEDPADGR